MKEKNCASDNVELMPFLADDMAIIYDKKVLMNKTSSTSNLELEAEFWWCVARINRSGVFSSRKNFYYNILDLKLRPSTAMTALN